LALDELLDAGTTDSPFPAADVIVAGAGASPVGPVANPLDQLLAS
jgi:hypothetical protein